MGYQIVFYVFYFRGHSSYINCVAVVDMFVVTGSADSTLRKWDMTTCECLFVYEGHTARVQKYEHFQIQPLYKQTITTNQVFSFLPGYFVQGILFFRLHMIKPLKLGYLTHRNWMKAAKTKLAFGPSKAIQKECIL